MKFNFNGFNIEVKSGYHKVVDTYKGSFKEARVPYHNSTVETRDRYTISIITNNGRWSTHFYDSTYNFRNKEEKVLDDSELADAFDCILSDAIYRMNSIDALDFYVEFELENEKEARRIFNACKKSHDNLTRLGFTDDMIFELSNKIREEF